MGWKAFSCDFTALAPCCGLLACWSAGLLAGGLLLWACNGQPALLVARLLDAGAATTLLAALVALLQPDPRPLWADLVVLGM